MFLSGESLRLNCTLRVASKFGRQGKYLIPTYRRIARSGFPACFQRRIPLRIDEGMTPAIEDDAEDVLLRSNPEDANMPVASIRLRPDKELRPDTFARNHTCSTASLDPEATTTSEGLAV